MQLVGGDDAQLGVAELPPELMADYSDVERGLGFWSVLNGEDDARGCEKQDHHNEHGNHSPRQFHLSAAVDLRRLLLRIGVARPEFDDDESEQSRNHDEDGASNQKNEEREPVNLVRGRGGRRQDGGRGLRALRECGQGAGSQHENDGSQRANWGKPVPSMHCSPPCDCETATDCRQAHAPAQQSCKRSPCSFVVRFVCRSARLLKTSLPRGMTAFGVDYRTPLPLSI